MGPRDDMSVSMAILREIMAETRSAYVTSDDVGPRVQGGEGAQEKREGLIEMRLVIASLMTHVTVMSMNESKLDEISLARLWHWRLGHPAADVPVSMDDSTKHKLNEDCYCCDQSKFKVGHFAKNDAMTVSYTHLTLPTNREV